MTEGVSIKLDVSSLTRVSNLLHSAGKNAPLAMIRAVNHTGDKARTQMRRVLVTQTGLKMKTIRKAVTSKRAFNGGTYEIKSRGGDIRLMFFGARETQKGVSAAPWNKRQVYPGTFMKGGLFPNRKGMVAGGAVVRRVGNAVKASIRVQGFRDDTGQLWQPGNLVWTESSFLDIAQDMLIEQVEYVQGEAGSIATLSLTDPRAYGGQGAGGGKGNQSGGEWEMGD